MCCAQCLHQLGLLLRYLLFEHVCTVLLGPKARVLPGLCGQCKNIGSLQHTYRVVLNLSVSYVPGSALVSVMVKVLTV